MSNSLRRRRAASTTVDPRERLFVGIDVHKRSHHVTLWSRERGLVTQWVQPADSALVLDRLTPCRGQIELVVHEAGPTGFGLVRTLRAAGLPAHVVAPTKLPRMIGRAKCDRLDSRRLAQFASQGLVCPIAVPTPQQEADRETVRARDTALIDVRRAKQRIRSFLLRHGLPEPHGWGPKGQALLRSLVVGAGLAPCLGSLMGALSDSLARLRALGREVSALASTARHAPRIAHLSSVPGVGPITSIIFCTELFSPERFGRGEEVASFLGLAPRVQASGETRREGPVEKMGNVRLRTALIEAAWQWVRRDASAQRRYRRHLAHTGSSKKAIVAMARRLAILLWTLSVRGEDYRGAAR